MLFLTEKGNRPGLFFFLSSLLFFCFSPPLEEMKDLIESSEADSTATVSIQSKGKGVEGALSLFSQCANILRTSLFINRFLLVLLSSAELKFPPPDESSALCSRVLQCFTLLVSDSLPLSVSIFFSQWGQGSSQSVWMSSSRAKRICKSSPIHFRSGTVTLIFRRKRVSPTLETDCDKLPANSTIRRLINQKCIACYFNMQPTQRVGLEIMTINHM